MKKTLVLISILALGTFAFAASAHADASAALAAPVQAPIVTADAVAATDPNQDLVSQIAALQKQAADPATGAISGFFIHLKIKELQNKLNVAKALQ